MQDPQYFIYYVPDYMLEDDSEARKSTTWLWVLGCFCLLFVCYLVFGPLSGLFSPTTNSPSASTHHLTVSSNASKRLVRLSQLDPVQYASQQEYATWSGSTCSTTSLTEVMNAYGRHYRITDVLKVESGISEITPQLGLLEDIGIQRTATQFGFKTTWGHNLSLDQIIAIANAGKPAIVSWPPDRWSGGHLLVVTGGNSRIVKLADSSLYDFTSLLRAKFLNYWEGYYAIVTPA